MRSFAILNCIHLEVSLTIDSLLDPSLLQRLLISRLSVIYIELKKLLSVFVDLNDLANQSATNFRFNTVSLIH